MSLITHIMVPTDFSGPSEKALEFALDVAARYHAAVLLLHVVEEPDYTTVYPDGYFIDAPELRDRLLKDANERLAVLVQACAAANVAAISRVVVGSPRHQIPREALSAKIDLIVNGTHGRTGLEHLLLGSVAELIVRIAPCPVLAVRDSGSSASSTA